MIGPRAPLFLLLLWLLPASLVQAAQPSRESLSIAVHLGAIRDASRVDVETSLKLWAEELMRTLEVPAKILFYRAMPEIRRDFEAGKVNFVIADGIDLLRHFAADDLADGLGGLAPSEDKLHLLTRRGAGIRTASDLAGKRVVLLSDNETSDLWMETWCLRQFQKSCERAGLQISKEARGRQQILELFFDKADVALVRGYAYEVAVELNPQIPTRIDILETVSLYPGALGLFSRKVSQGFREYAITQATKLNDHPRGRQMLEVMQTEKVGRVPHALLEPIRALVHEHDTLSRRYLTAGGRK